MKNRIESIRIETVSDESPDLSYLGEFTNDASPEAFIRYGEHQGKQVKELGEDDELPDKGREYRFFLPAMTGEQTGNPDSPKQDWARAEDHGNGWFTMGVIAKAVIVSAQGVTQTLRSGGLWGVDSDSDREYLQSIKQDELAALKQELAGLGFGARAIAYAIKNATV